LLKTGNGRRETVDRANLAGAVRNALTGYLLAADYETGHQ
jgi:hypothetical protein